MPDEELEYISLQKATRYCNYTQEYLSLRARQGKLKAVKFGRNWFVKREWLEEYLKNVEEYNHNLKNNLSAKENVAPPENLPVEETFPKFLEFQFKKFRFPKPALQIRFGFVAVLVFVSLITGIFHARESFKIVYDDTSQIVSDTIFSIPQSFQFVSNEINSQLLNVSYQVAGIGEFTTDTIKEYFQWLSQGYLTVNDLLEKNLREDVHNLVWGVKNLARSYLAINDLLEKNLRQDSDNLVWGAKGLPTHIKIYVRGLVFKVKKEALKFAKEIEGVYQFVIGPWREIPIAEKPMRPKPEEGAVVVPYSAEKTAEVKGKLEEAFSDKVEVKPDETGRAGIIKPLIKAAEAQEYLYLIVPVQEQ